MRHVYHWSENYTDDPNQSPLIDHNPVVYCNGRDMGETVCYAVTGEDGLVLCVRDLDEDGQPIYDTHYGLVEVRAESSSSGE